MVLGLNRPVPPVEGDTNAGPQRDAWDRDRPEASKQLIDRDAKTYLHQSLSTPCLEALVQAKGCYLYTAGGQRLLDFHGNSVHQLGHGHPAVLEAVEAELHRLPFCPRRFTNQPAIELAERLGRLTDHQLPRVLLAPGGSEAVGMALKLARIVTGRYKTISLYESFHGATLDAISVGGQRLFSQGLGPLMPGAIHVPIFEPRRCPQQCEHHCTGDCFAYLRYVAEREGDIAAVIAEPLRCTTVRAPGGDYWRQVRELCNRIGALLIFDEIPLALGRTAAMFAHTRFGVVPDMLVLGKGLGGGIMPMAALLAKEHLNVAGHLALGHYTHEKSPAGSAAALAVLNVLEQESLLDHAEEMGARLEQGLLELQQRHHAIHEVRRFGLLLGIELQNTGGRSAEDLAQRSLYSSFEGGLSFKVSDGRVLTLAPPLILQPAQVDEAIAILDQALTQASHQSKADSSRGA